MSFGDEDSIIDTDVRNKGPVNLRINFSTLTLFNEKFSLDNCFTLMKFHIHIAKCHLNKTTSQSFYMGSNLCFIEYRKDLRKKRFFTCFKGI